MKKTLLIIVLLLGAFAGNAQNVAKEAAGLYYGQLFISIQDEITDNNAVPMEGQSIVIEAQSNNTVKFALYNFSLAEGFSLGDIVLENIPVSKDANGKITFGKNNPVRFAFMDGNILADASINSTGSYVDKGDARVDVDVVWVQEGGVDIPIYVRFLGSKATLQVPNSDFESWVHTNEPGNGWYSFHSASGSQAGTGRGLSEPLTTQVTGSNAYSGTSVQIESKWVGILVFGANANGNLTTGRINMGSTTPADASNHNFSDTNSENCCRFEGRPDSVAYYATYKRGQSGDYRGRLHAILHGDIDYKDPSESAENKAQYLIAEATVYADVTDKWTRFVGPLKYTGIEGDKTYMLCSFTTNETPGATVGDVMRIDNVEFIYNSELASFTYDGKKQTIATNMKLENETYDATKVKLTSTGHAATILTSYDKDNALLTITVRGQNAAEKPSNVHVYTVQFKKEETGISTISAPTTNGSSVYDIQGRRVMPTSKGIYIIGGKKVLR